MPKLLGQQKDNNMNAFCAFYLLPQCFSGGQTGAGSYKPTVPQLALVQVMGTDAIHKQMRVAA